MNSIIKFYNQSLEEAINTRGADVAKDAALRELSPIIEEGCLMPMDRLTIKKLKADKQLLLPSKLFQKPAVDIARTTMVIKAHNHQQWPHHQYLWWRQDRSNAGMRGWPLMY